MHEMTLSKLAESVGGVVEGDADAPVKGIAPIDQAGPGDVTFFANAKYEKLVATTQATAVIVPRDYRGETAAGTSLIRCADPYVAFRDAMVAVYGFRKPAFEGVDPRANIHPTATLADDVKVGAFATVEAGSVVGPGTVIYPNVYVGPNCRVGSGCILYPNVVLYDGSILGDRVTVHAGSSIGQDGFGYATHKFDDGVIRHDKIPAAGWVVLEDDVEIGANCAIDRATVGATIIGEGTKFSNLVTIGHGTRMGRHCLAVAQVGVAGSVMVGNYCVFGGQCGVVGHIRIGDGAKMLAQSGVTNDVQPGQEMLGSPAIPRAEARRSMVGFAQLPQLRDAVKKLSRELSRLEARIAGGQDPGDDR